MEQPHLMLQGVGHRFGERRIFSGISLEIGSGQVGVIAGKNGSGKSTLLRIVSGLIASQEGDVDCIVAGKSLDSRARRAYVGYVAPDLRLYHELSGVENLKFFAELRGLSLSYEMLRSLLERVGLLGRGSDLVGDYSSGMRQRLKYGLALLANPPILLLDEPTANLDLDGVNMVERVISDQCRRVSGGLVLVATNEVREEEWADCLVRLNDTAR